MIKDSEAMKQTGKNKTIVMHWMAAFAVVAIMSTNLTAQTLPESVKQLETAVKNLKSVASLPDQMVEWDTTLARYNRDSFRIQALKTELSKQKESLKTISARRNYINEQKKVLKPDEAWKAEDVLARRYNATQVEQALRNLEPRKNEEHIANLCNRLSQYASMTDTLKNVLTEVNQTDKNGKNRITFDLDEGKADYWRDFFGKIQEKLPPELFNPQSYPYLYEVLNDALEAKMNDTGCDFKEIIDKL